MTTLLRRLLSTVPAGATGTVPPAVVSSAVSPVTLANNVVLSPSSDTTNLNSENAMPKSYLKRTAYIQRDFANVRQSLRQHDERAHWRIHFDNSDREGWVNQLMGWRSTGDALVSTGVRKIKFPSAESASAFAAKMGFNKQVVCSTRGDLEPERKSITYAENFLNPHVKDLLKRNHPRRSMKVQFGHPQRTQSAWVNLGNMAVEMGTSTQRKREDSQVSQLFWADKTFDADKNRFRYDTYEQRLQMEAKRGRDN